MPADPQRLRVDVEGRPLELSNLDKVLYPAVGFTKGEVIDYYTRVAPVLLPHLADRPLTRIRFPNGAGEKSFFEKNKPAATPDWVRVETLPAPGSSKGRDTIDYVVADDLPTLVWLANLAALELHTPQWKIGRHPDMMVVDLDPGAPAALRQCCQVALLMRDRLADDGIDSYPKTSGKKGMQLCCPIAATQPAEVVSGYARRIAQELERAQPKLIVSKMAKNLRPGKVFIDWSQNSAAKTTVAPYSLRAQAVPAVSTPLTWDEVAAGAAGKRPSSKPYTADEVLKRVEKCGDLLAPLLDGGPELPVR
jgi:bifunctional non-homologous end joining protein LigD